MNTGTLHIVKSDESQVFLKKGYFENIMPSVRRCYDTQLIPFFFKYIPGSPIPDSITKSLSIVAVEVLGGEIIDQNESEISSTELKEIENENGTWTLYFNPESLLTGLDILNGLHQFKIEIEGVEYRSEPFLCCFNTLVALAGGSFDGSFDASFDIGS